MGRFLKSISYVDNSIEFILLDKIEDSNHYHDDIGIFGGFLPGEVLKNNTINKKIYVFCSPFGQADLSSDDFYSAEIRILYNSLMLLERGYFTRIITSSKPLAQYYDKVFYLSPVIKMPGDYEKWITKERYGYGFLGNNLRKHKNVVNQLAAIAKLNPSECTFVTRQKISLYDGWSELFPNLKIINKVLQSDEDYFKHIATHRLNFQCSFSESFDYMALEYAYMGIPTICSSCIDWYPLKQCVVNNPDNWVDIWGAAQETLNYNYSDYLISWSKEFNQYNKERLIQQIENLKKV